MKLIVISNPATIPNEINLVTELFENGLEIFHIHKPDFSKKETEKFIQEIPAKYHKKIFSHADFPKFHSLQELEEYKEKYEYAFLSPVFDSISKAGYKSKFNDRLYKFVKFSPELINAINGKKIIALGGVDLDKIALVRKTGFAGVGVLGAIWNSKDPVEKFKRVKAKCEKKDVVF